MGKSRDAKTTIGLVLNSKFGYSVKTEFKGIEGRKFRFDYAIPEIKLAIEYEGIMGFKSRHTGVVGYSNDTIKYNLAQLQGWTVLRYTQLTYQDLGEQLEIFMKARVEGIK